MYQYCSTSIAAGCFILSKNSKQKINNSKTHKPWFTVQCKFQRQNYRKLKRKSKRYKTDAVKNELAAAERQYKRTLDIRDRPFNLKGGLWFFVSFRNFFSDNTRVRIFIFLSRKARNFFPEFNIRLYDKNSESDYFFFLHQNQNIFFSNIGNQNSFLEKKT